MDNITKMTKYQEFIYSLKIKYHIYKYFNKPYLNKGSKEFKKNFTNFLMVQAIVYKNSKIKDENDEIKSFKNSLYNEFKYYNKRYNRDILKSKRETLIGVLIKYIKSKIK